YHRLIPIDSVNVFKKTQACTDDE
ncbi:hypothetical protein MGSAQ_001117, partial [marine sediment metagenome]